MLDHIQVCAVAHDNGGPPHPLVVLHFAAKDDSRYWLVVEAKAEATLHHIDGLLRELWLECCGHMSAFHVGRRELAMTTTAAMAFTAPKARLEYEYDFGSTTALTGTLVGDRRGAIGRDLVRLLARNESLGLPCSVCKAAATIVCPYCIDTDNGLFCKAHAGTHEHADEEVYLPVVNSPRMGVCGYTG